MSQLNRVNCGSHLCISMLSVGISKSCSTNSKLSGRSGVICSEAKTASKTLSILFLWLTPALKLFHFLILLFLYWLIPVRKFQDTLSATAFERSYFSATSWLIAKTPLFQTLYGVSLSSPCFSSFRLNLLFCKLVLFYNNSSLFFAAQI